MGTVGQLLGQPNDWLAKHLFARVSSSAASLVLVGVAGLVASELSSNTDWHNENRSAMDA